MFEWLTMQWQSIDWHVIWKTVGQIGLTFVLTTIIGWQREQEEHNTGVRTFPIVGMASCGYLADSRAAARYSRAIARAARD